MEGLLSTGIIGEPVGRTPAVSEWRVILPEFLRAGNMADPCRAGVDLAGLFLRAADSRSWVILCDDNIVIASLEPDRDASLKNGDRTTYQ
jgi:hypothetical protein